MKKIFVSLIFITLYTTTAFAEIIETSDFAVAKKLLDTADQHSLVIFDIDEVIIQTTDAILKPQYKAHLVKWEKELLERTSEEVLVYLRSIIFQEQNIKLVDDQILDTFNKLKAKKITTIAITYIPTGPRGKIAKFEDWGLSRLQKFNIDFRNFNNLPDHTFSDIPAKHGTPMTKNGVTFTALAPKGTLLNALLKYNNLKPNKIIFIDDKLSNLASVESVCKNLNIPFIGIHYTKVIKSDQWHINEEIAKLQFKVLENEYKWLSDQQAKAILLSVSND